MFSRLLGSQDPGNSASGTISVKPFPSQVTNMFSSDPDVLEFLSNHWNSGRLDLTQGRRGAVHSASPAFRRPSANIERCSGRLIGSQSLIFEMRNPGSSLRSSSIARLASSWRPLSARVAAINATTMRKLGRLLYDRSAHVDAVPMRPANKCAIAIPACMR